jgi:hypothetical protein
MPDKMPCKIYLFPSWHLDVREAGKISAALDELFGHSNKVLIGMEVPNVSIWHDAFYNLDALPDDMIDGVAHLTEFPEWTRAALAMLSERKNSERERNKDMDIYSLDASAEKEVQKKLKKIEERLKGILNALDAAATGEETLTLTIEWLRTVGARDRIRDKIMLMNVKRIARYAGDSPVLIITGATHTMYLERALGKEGYDTTVIGQVPDHVKMMDEAASLARSPNPDRERIAHLVQEYNRIELDLQRELIENLRGDGSEDIAQMGAIARILMNMRRDEAPGPNTQRQRDRNQG